MGERPDEEMSVRERGRALGSGPIRIDDPAGLEAAWHTHRRWVAAILLAHKPREVDLEDLLQDVAMKLVANADSLRDPAAVRGWLRQVALNVARTSGRRQTVRRAAFDDRAGTEYAAQESSADLARIEAREDGKRALDVTRTLPEAYREVLVLRAVRGLSYKQIGEILGVPVTTVETRLARARRMVRAELERGGEVAGRVDGFTTGSGEGGGS